MDNKTTAAPLRASCERCRAQKLRCMPAPKTATGGPCKRCVKAKVAESCVYNSRFKTGRGAGRSRKLSENGGSPPGGSGKETDTSTPALPGMSTFVLPAVETPYSETMRSDSMMALSNQTTPPKPDLDDNRLDSTAVTLEGDMAGLWQHDTSTFDMFSLNDFMNQSSDLFSETYYSASTDDTGIQLPRPDLMNDLKPLSPKHDTVYPAFQGLKSSFSEIVPLERLNLDMLLEDGPGPLIELSALLTEMSAYESRLPKSSGCKFHDFPIGDAIFLSHRFYSILSNSSRNPSTNPASHMSTSTQLLAFSCFITLARIYSDIFNRMRDYLSQLLELHSAQQPAEHLHTSLGSDVHLYRGLRLRQLQPMCLCSAWDPAKKAVSMLLGSLRSVESLLGLPSDLRVVHTSETDGQAEQPSMAVVSAEDTVLDEEDDLALLANGSLHKTIKKQATQLRGKVQAANKLLQEPCSYISIGQD